MEKDSRKDEVEIYTKSGLNIAKRSYNFKQIEKAEKRLR